MALQKDIHKQANCNTEYGKLSNVIVCPPRYMQIDAIINETQKHYKDDNLDIDKASQQHERFIEVLKENGVEVQQFSPEPPLYEQVFTRDIGFCIGANMFVSSMKNRVRKEEETILEEYLNKQGISFSTLPETSIEGGDILVNGNKVWIGLSDRTSDNSVDALRKKLPSYQLIPLALQQDILHLDCAFNILSPEWAVVYPQAFSKEDFREISRNYKLIEVDTDEQFTLGTNVLSIGNSKIISMPVNKKVNGKMRTAGFEVLEVEFSEIIKSGGSFRCCTLPFLRE